MSRISLVWKVWESSPLNKARYQPDPRLIPNTDFVWWGWNVDRADYIAKVAASIAERVQRDADTGDAEVNDLAADVAWIARQLSMIAEQHR